MPADGILGVPGGHVMPGFAGVAKLVDALDLGSSAERLGSSSLPARTRKPAPFGGGAPSKGAYLSGNSTGPLFATR